MKKAYTIDQQIARLKSNGMTFDDEEKAKEEDEIQNLVNSIKTVEAQKVVAQTSKI